ncbi:hypothetical protein P608_19420 [Comamonas thiooxydans]|uniref:Malate/L-lactate dehydrogenase n=1 Tax=Comamonas thiooxydans TaxID=363952 RepID=A0A0E3BQ98_9BURK|nr:hypothetical protein P608_19420 [Comamonas thiooxydans]KGH16556.1 hypothetical protein P607_20020 [Comamonas thiooxydans]KGH20880.1 hypothetical protein P606_19205 [Comamonas thiooxydans]
MELMPNIDLNHPGQSAQTTASKPGHTALTLDEVHNLAYRVFTHLGLSAEHAQAIARVITAGERDECHSHGMYRVLSCARTLQHGAVVRDAIPIISDRGPGVVAVDAQRGFSQLAFEVGSKVLLEKVRTTGIAALAINNCYHFSALWPEIEALVEHGVAALAMTPSHSWVALRAEADLFSEPTRSPLVGPGSVLTPTFLTLRPAQWPAVKLSSTKEAVAHCPKAGGSTPKAYQVPMPQPYSNKAPC